LLSGTTRAVPFATPGSTGNATSCSPPFAPASFPSPTSQALSAFGASLDDVRRRLHATDESGRLIVGADVAIAIWRITPGEGWLASLFGNPVMLPVTRFAYDRFADLLFAWNRRKGRW
jgi:predicted DCC family thiol-disulfide oxidoreductase YuxK